MIELVRGYAAACTESALVSGNLAQMRGDLAEFDRAFAASDELRRVLSDPGVSVAARRAIVSELVEGKSVPESAALLEFAVSNERPADISGVLISLLQLVERDAEQAAQHHDFDPEPLVGHLATRERIFGYATRVLAEVEALDEVDEVEDELFRFARLVDTYPSLRRALADGTTPYGARSRLVRELLAHKAKPATVWLVSYVLRAGRTRDLVGTIEWLVDLAAAERGRRVAEVRAAVELDDGERDRLAAALARLVGRTVEVRVVIDPSVVGGALVEVGDLLIDGTVRLRFERLHDLLTPQA